MNERIQHISTGAKHTMDVLSIGTVAATILQWLPSIAAAVSIVWTLIRIYETATVQKLIARFTGTEREGVE